MTPTSHAVELGISRRARERKAECRVQLDIPVGHHYENRVSRLKSWDLDNGERGNGLRENEAVNVTIEHHRPVEEGTGCRRLR
jgi:hypothetical protein